MAHFSPLECTSSDTRELDRMALAPKHIIMVHAYHYRMDGLHLTLYLTLMVHACNCIHLSFQDGGSALTAASLVGQVECVKMLLDKGAAVNMQKKVSGERTR